MALDADVVVVGGGPAGLMAAIAAAEEGASVTLLEQRAFVGGNLSIGLPLLGFLNQHGEQVIRGLAQTFVERLQSMGAATDHQPCPLHVSFTLIEPDVARLVALDMLRRAGVNVIPQSFCVGTEVRANNLEGAIVESKSGRETVTGKVFIDCTGDGDVAFHAGVQCHKGDERGQMQPPTLMFAMRNVDTETLRLSLANRPDLYDVDYIPPEYFRTHNRFIAVGLRRLIQEARNAGLSIPTDRTILITGLQDGEVWVNMTRVKGVDGTDARSLSYGEAVAAEQIHGICTYLTEYVPGFRNASLSRVAPFLGIRETRRVSGLYELTREDIVQGRRFPDAVAVGSYPIDLHSPSEDDCRLEWSRDSYDIPYRSLIAKDLDNLLVAGRCISATHEAMAAIRVMPTCMAMGEAAGCAAAIAVREGMRPADVDALNLRSKLLARGAYLR